MDKLRIFALLAGSVTMGGIGVARAGSSDETRGYGGHGEAEGYGGSPSEEHRRRAPDCQVVMRDSHNAFSTLLTSDGHGYHHDIRFRVTSDDGAGKWDEKARFKDRSARMETSAGVPHWSLTYIRDKYDSLVDAFHDDGVVEVDGQLTYVLMPGADCSKDEFAMIHFFVVEWFYYG